MRRVVFAGSGFIFFQRDIEAPVEAIFDVPVSADDVHCFTQLELTRGEKKPLAGLPACFGFENNDGPKAREIVLLRHIARRNDPHATYDRTAMAPVFLSSAAPPFHSELSARIAQQAGLVAVQRQDPISAAFADHTRHRAMTMQRTGGDVAPAISTSCSI